LRAEDGYYLKGKTMIPCKNIFELIDLIQQRTSMFIPDKSIDSLQTYLNGYESCMWVHSIIEQDVPVFKHFREWLARTFNYQFTSLGWAYAIRQNIDPNQDPLQKFFDLVQDFRKLRPCMITSIKLKPRHQPTGKIVMFGDGKLMAPPVEIQVIQYKPEELFLLRHHYADRYENSFSLFSSAKEAKRWVEEEFQVSSEEWN
jgi:hypothetical protein